jgi:hypothetical protein
MANRRSSSIKVLIPIIAVLITAIATIIVALINNGSFDKRSAPSPTISISSVLKDKNGQSIDINNAPFQVSVSGTVSNADGLYVYLIVVDKNHHYVQPGLGANVNNDFSNLSFLGEKDNPEAGGQQYTIYAVVTDKPYPEFAWFDGESFLVKSKELKITRGSVLTPTP